MKLVLQAMVTTDDGRSLMEVVHGSIKQTAYENKTGEALGLLAQRLEQRLVTRIAILLRKSKP